MNESTIRQRLREALGESPYPPYLTSRVTAALSRPAEKQQTNLSVLGLVAAALAIAIVLTFVFGFHAQRPRSSVPVQPPVATPASSPGCQASSNLAGGLYSIKMTSPSTGWANDGLRTTDGGAHWSRVLPSALFAGIPAPALANGVYPPGFVEFDLDGSHYWALRTYLTPVGCYDHAVTFATSDGGRTWQQSEAIPLTVPSGWGAEVSGLEFSDSLHGWIWTAMGPRGADPFSFLKSLDERDLYATSDGGQHWRLVTKMTPSGLGITLPSGCTFSLGDVAFVTTDTGWMTLNCQTATPELVMTSDGGVTWKMKRLPIPAGAACPCVALQPTFLDPSDGVVEIRTNSGSTAPQGATLLSTSDGGGTWQSLPPTPSTGYEMAIDYADSTHWWSLLAQPGWNKTLPTNDWLYTSADSGRSWTLVQKDLPLGFRVYALQFFDADHGIAIQDQNATAGGAPSQGIEVLTTSDGGHTWRVSVAQVTISN